jgi:WD40 repeat protein
MIAAGEAKRREPVAKELAELDTMVASLRKSENFGPARDLLAQAARRHEDAEWTGEIAKRTDSLAKAVQDLFSQVAGEAEQAKRAGLALEVDARRTRVRQWNWPGLAKDLDDSLAKIATAPPPTPPPAPPPPPVVVPGPSALVEQAPFIGSLNAIHSISISPDQQTYLTSSFEGTVRLWDAATRKPRILHEGGEKATASAISPDGKTLAAGFSDGKVRLWDMATLKPRTLTVSHSTQVLGLVFARLHPAAVGEHGRNRKLWDVAKGMPRPPMEGHPKGAMCAAIDPTGKLAAVGAASQLIKLWELPTGREVRNITIGADACFRVAFLPDGKSLVSTGNRDVIQWDLLTLTPRVFGSHNQLVRGLAVSPNGRWIVSTSPDDALKIWDAASATLVETIPHENAFYGVAFSPAEPARRRLPQLPAAGLGHHGTFRRKPK